MMRAVISIGVIMKTLKLLSRLLFVFFVTLQILNVQASNVTGSVTGTVQKIGLHQYNDKASAWHKNIWFCLNSDTSIKTIGSCPTSAKCGGNMLVTILNNIPEGSAAGSSNAGPEFYSTVLAARLSSTPIQVSVDDQFKFSGFCVARAIIL